MSELTYLIGNAAILLSLWLFVRNTNRGQKSIELDVQLLNERTKNISERLTSTQVSVEYLKSANSSLQREMNNLNGAILNTSADVEEMRRPATQKKVKGAKKNARSKTK